MSNLQLRRGTEGIRGSILPLPGEPLYVTNTGKLYFGDGSTLGGTPLRVDIADVIGLTGVLSDKANNVHTHAINAITGLQDALDAKANNGHAHAISAITGLPGALDGKADVNHSHDARYPRVDTSGQGLNSTQRANARANLGLGSAAVLDAPTSGDATANQVVLGNDSRLGAGGGGSGDGALFVSLGNMSGNVNINAQGQRQIVAYGTLTGNVTLNVTNRPSSGPIIVTLFATQDNTGSRGLTPPANTSHLNGGNGSLNPAANVTNLITLVSHNGGSRWYMAVADSRPTALDPYLINPQGNGAFEFFIDQPERVLLNELRREGTGTIQWARKPAGGSYSNISAVATVCGAGDLIRGTVSGYSTRLTLAVPREAL